MFVHVPVPELVLVLLLPVLLLVVLPVLLLLVLPFELVELADPPVSLPPPVPG
jgi:hypothetical protein